MKPLLQRMHGTGVAIAALALAAANKTAAMPRATSDFHYQAKPLPTAGGLVSTESDPK